MRMNLILQKNKPQTLNFHQILYLITKSSNVKTIYHIYENIKHFDTFASAWLISNVLIYPSD